MGELAHIIPAKVFHQRSTEVSHRFRYTCVFYSFDLSALKQLSLGHWLFSYNRFSLLSLRDRDYLLKSAGSIEEKLWSVLKDCGLDRKPEKVILASCPRFFGMVFNPASFYFCYDGKDNLTAFVTEVNNTFSEKHVYVLTEFQKSGDFFTASQPKAFHVSPFFPVEGEYSFKWKDIRQGFEVSIQVRVKSKLVFHSRVEGNLNRFSSLRIAWTCFRYPLIPVLTLPRILWQAAVLYYQKGVPVFRKPEPKSSLTLRSEPDHWLQKLGLNFVSEHLKQNKKGSLSIELPNHEVLEFKGGEPGVHAQIKLGHYDFFRKLLFRADIGLGESFMNGDWHTPNLVNVLRYFVTNLKNRDHRRGFARWFGLFSHRIRFFLRSNTILGSQRNIRAHYDLGNEFFQSFLDPRMLYSSGIYETGLETLGEAQLKKIHRIISKARITKDCHVLEVGCGWGGFAIEAVKKTGCRVTGITVSQQQYDLACARVKEEGLEDRISIELRDYRQVEGRFDRIVSIEMLEAVGHENLDAYFSALDKALKPNGIAVIQVITVPDQRYDRYRRESDWLQKYIFPGAVCPSLTALSQSMTRSSGLIVENLENIGDSYAITLGEWRKNFLSKISSYSSMGLDDRFCRMWDYYFAICQASFEERYIGDLQLVLTRARNRNLI